MRDDAPIALLIPELNGGGAQRVVANLANVFAERGLRVDVVVARAEGPLLADLSPSVRLVDCSSRKIGQFLHRTTKYLRAERPRAMLTTLRDANIVGPLARLLAGARTRVVVREANTLAQGQRRGGIRQAVLTGLMRTAYRSADHIVANSRATADDLVRFGLASAGAVQVIHNPLDIAEIRRAAAEPLDHPWFVCGSSPVILGVGRLVPQKDFTTFLQAVALVRRVRDVRAMILGDGPLRSELENEVSRLGLQGSVQMPGFVKNPHRYFSRASVFALSSRWEGFGNVMVEALAVGTPVVATDCPGGPSEILAQGEFGELVLPGDAHALAEAIDRCLSTTPDRERLRARAEAFDVDGIATSYLRSLGVNELDRVTEN